MTDAPTDADAEAVDEGPAPPEEAFGALVSWSRGQQVLHPDRASYLAVAEALREDGFAMCVDVCATDYLLARQPRALPPGVQAERFEVVANFLDHAGRRRIRVRVQVPESDPTCPSLWPAYASVEGPEREVFDMFGITFDGHPDMTRILMPENWQGHPLRKDYATGRIPVQFKGAPSS